MRSKMPTGMDITDKKHTHTNSKHTNTVHYTIDTHAAGTFQIRNNLPLAGWSKFAVESLLFFLQFVFI